MTPDQIADAAPTLSPDRRETSRLNVNHHPTDRRLHERFDVSQYQSAFIKGGKKQGKIPVKVLDASATGLSVEVPSFAGLRLGDTAVIRWDVPPILKDMGSSAGIYTLTGKVIRIVPGDGHSLGCCIQLKRLISEQIVHQESRPVRIGTVIAALLLTALIVLLKINNVLNFWYAPWIFTYSLIIASYVYVRVMLSIVYTEPVDNGYTPTVSVLISAKNEEGHIRENVESVFSSRYPAGRLEVIVVDDGSTDHTWEMLNKIKEEYPTLRIFRFPENLGKRRAMGYGAEQATNDVLVHVDSDSLVHEEGIYRLVQPLFDPAVGAVAGHIDVIVEKDNIISKMEVVRYQISQRVIKAAESFFNVVTCCSGPFSAYRRVSVKRVLPQWINQNFWGSRATFGDDRSLTNLILQTHRVVYHAGAHCATYVPRTWSQFFNQQLRWKKSWSRESIIAAGFMYRKHPIAALLFYTSILITLLSPLVAFRALVFLPVVMSTSCLSYLLGLMLINLFLGAIFYYYTRSRYWPYLMVFVVVYILALCWQTYYAILTIPRTHWGTR